MPLLDCADCGKSISDSAPSCPGCGRPMMVALAEPPKPATYTPVSQIPAAPRCRSCGGSDLKSLRLLKQMGQSDISLSTVGRSSGGGFGMVAGRLAAFATSSSTTSTTVGNQQSHLARNLAEPVCQKANILDYVRVLRWYPLGGLVVIEGFYLLTLGRYADFLFPMICAVFSVILIRKFKALRGIGKPYQADYERRLRDWNQSGMCMICGDIQPISIR
jgi:hypothetical protein